MTTSRRSPFLRFASTVADLGSPFYDEERQRDVWNEASAFGLRLFLWGSFALSAAMFWIGGRPLLPYGFAVLGLATAISYLVIGYARALGVEVAVTGRLANVRIVVFLLVFLVMLAGASHAVTGGAPSAGFLTGLVIGAGGAGGLLVGQYWWRRRRDRDREAAENAHPGL